MILYDKTALTGKLGRKVTNYIETLLTPDSDEERVRKALEKLMKVDIEKYSLKYGNEPAEILVAAAVGFLRLKGGSTEAAGTVAVDNFNEAISLDPELDNDYLFRQDFLYELIKAGAEQGDAALQAVLCDLYVGDVVAPGPESRFERDELTVEQLRKAIGELSARSNESNDVSQALGVAGISPEQLECELDWVPYEDNAFAKARMFAQAGRAARNDGRTGDAATAYYRSALLGNVESAAAYVALTTGLFAPRNRKNEVKAYKLFKKTLAKAQRAGRAGVPDEKLSTFFERKALLEHPGAILTRAELLRNSLGRDEVVALVEQAADKGDINAELTAAEYYSKPGSFDFDKMMRYLFEGLVNPCGWYAVGNVRVPLNLFAQDYSALAYEKMGNLFSSFCYERDMIDELEELSAPCEMTTPELTTGQREAIFMWFLCDPGSDFRREVLARFYATGFGTGKDLEKALEIRRALCEKYIGATGARDRFDEESATGASATGARDRFEGIIETSESEDETAASPGNKTGSENDKTVDGHSKQPNNENLKEELPENNDRIEAGDIDLESAGMFAGSTMVQNEAKEGMHEIPYPELLTEGSTAVQRVPETGCRPGGGASVFSTNGTTESSSAEGDQFAPYESYYTYALYLITAEGKERDTEKGIRLLKLIPEESKWSRKAAKLLSLTETKTSELLRLGAMFHKEGNDAAMRTIYEAAEKLGDPVAARALGRYYSLPENGGDNGVALRHFALGASRGDIQSMYFAGVACQNAGNYSAAYDYFKACAENEEKAVSEDDKAVIARAMRENAELYYNGSLTGEKNVPKYLYWLDRAETAGYRLSDAAIDRRRAAENYFKPAQWQTIFIDAMSDPDNGYKEWAARTCSQRKVPAAQEEYGVMLYKKAVADNSSGRSGADRNGPGAYQQLKTPALSSPRAQYYSACALFLGVGCERNVDAAERMLPPESEFGDPEQLRHEISGMAAYLRAEERGERHSEEAEELLRKAEEEFTAVFEEYGRDNVRFELADLLIRAYGVPDKFSTDELDLLWRRGYSYLIGGYLKDARCTSRVNEYSGGRICEIARLFEGDDALAWYGVGVSRGDAAAQYGAGAIYLARAKSSPGGRIIDEAAFAKAKELISRAATQENADAEFSMYSERLPFDVDNDEARLYLKRSAIHGNALARDLCRELEIAF